MVGGEAGLAILDTVQYSTVQYSTGEAGLALLDMEDPVQVQVQVEVCVTWMLLRRQSWPLAIRWVACCSTL